MVSHKEASVILLVEDQPDDVILTGLAIKKAGLPHQLRSVPDGSDAVRYLSGLGEYTNRVSYPIPALMLLDLKMPQLDGFGLLSWLQGRREYEDIAVVVLTSSNLPSDVARAKALGADDYIVKPNYHADLVEVLKVLNSRWLLSPAHAAREAFGTTLPPSTQSSDASKDKSCTEVLPSLKRGRQYMANLFLRRSASL